MKIWVHTVVHNEEKFIWFAIRSVIDYVDKILIWDTGSTDRTVEIINLIKKEYPKKIDFKQVGAVTNERFTKVRQEMLDVSNCDWILIVDGDEVWWKDSLKKVIRVIKEKGDSLDGIVVPFYTLIGDIYHYQEERAGKYNILGKRGHLSLKAINRNIPNLHLGQPYGKEGYFNGENQLIQESKKLTFIDAPFMHFTHLRRSSQKRRFDKFKYEIGIKFPENFKYPEVFFMSYPREVSSPWGKLSKNELALAKFATFLRKLKRGIDG